MRSRLWTAMPLAAKAWRMRVLVASRASTITCRPRPKQEVRVQAVLELRRGAERDHLAAVHQRDAVAVFGFIHVMRADENSMAGFGKVVDEAPKSAARDRVDTGSGLVEKENRRIVQDGAAQRQPLLPAAGKRAGHGRTAVGEVGHFEHVLLALGADFVRNAVHAGEEVDILFHREVVVEREFSTGFDVPAALATSSCI